MTPRPTPATVSEATVSEATVSEATVSEATVSEATVSEAAGVGPDLCCSTVTAEGIDESQADELAELFRALADPARIRVLSLVANASGGELCACDLTGPLDRAQPTVSHHLAILVDAGLLAREKRGRWAWYRLVPERLDQIRSLLAVPQR